MIERKQAVAEFMRRLYARGLTTTSGGNVSLRVSAERILLTASGTDKASLGPDEVAELDLDGTNLTPPLKPSIESEMHLAIYRRHPAVQAILHAHPPCASAFTASRVPLNTRLVAEAYAVLGEPAVAPYARMGTPELAESAARALDGPSPCVLLANHGVLCVGRTLLEAFDRVEVLEQAARIQLYVTRLGEAVEMSPQQCCDIDAMMQRPGNPDPGRHTEPSRKDAP